MTCRCLTLVRGLRGQPRQSRTLCHLLPGMALRSTMTDV
jgi:hypothetical protein